ncbi:MAG: Dabb family protein [Pedosphaera sp.]|nr:Dabb family protein [Pedosphaera sp.]
MAKVKHIALFKFKEGTSEEQIQQLFDQLMEISETILGIEDYVSGTNNSPEGLSQGHTHGFVMSFADAAARDAYLGHPDHERFKAALASSIEGVVVFDFEV